MRENAAEYDAVKLVAKIVYLKKLKSFPSKKLKLFA